jgi:two-component system, chemotaxis family, chemotaxis protein CheY
MKGLNIMSTNTDANAMSYSILIVDDSALTRSVIKRTISMAGIDAAPILEAGDGKSACEVLRQQKIDLVLMDLNMPVMGGLEATRKIREQPECKDVNIVIVSSESTAGRIEQLKQQGVQGYIKKPFTPEQIKCTIEQILGSNNHV